MRKFHKLRELKTKIFDVILPPSCVLCRSDLQSQESAELCSNCWEQVRFITKPFCKTCGLPLEYGDDDQICIGCLKNAHDFDSARAAIIYGSVGKDLILKFKHNDKASLSKILSGWLVRIVPDIPIKNKGSVVLAPVPLHWSRLLYRKYNQAALLSKHVSLRLDIPCIFDLLKRSRRTKSQGHLGLDQRRLNVKNAFQVRAKYQNSIKEKAVVLIDDVFTTGSTVNECAKVLKAAGASEVHVVTVAKTDHPWRVL